MFPFSFLAILLQVKRRIREGEECEGEEGEEEEEGYENDLLQLFSEEDEVIQML